MMRRALLLVIVWGFLVPGLGAQHFRYSTRNYTAIDGLPQSQVTAIEEDANGYLWIGTEGGGLARFDGNEFKVYTTKNGLLSNNIMGLHIDRHQNLWILHAQGISKFDGLTFKLFQSAGAPNGATRLRRIFEHGDSIFALTLSGVLTKIHHDSLFYWEKPLVANKHILRFHESAYGINCFFLDDGSFAIQKDGQLVTMPGPDNEKPNFFFDYKGDILFRTEKDLYKLDHKNRKIEKLPWSIEHYVLLYDQRRDFFWTCHGSTLFRETIKDGIVKCDTILRDVDIYHVVNDSEGNAWFASNGRGLYKYFSQDFNRCGPEDLRGVMAIASDHDNTMWLGTMAKGLWRIRKGKISSYLEDDKNYRTSVRLIKVSPEGTLWVATGNGLGRYNKERDDFDWFDRKNGLSASSIIALDFDERGRLWIGTQMGISLYDGTSFHNYNTSDGLVSNHCWTLHYSRKYKTLFIGNDFGVQSVKNGKIDTVPILGLSNTGIIGIQPYRDSLLMIATGGAGVAIFNPETRTRKFLTTEEGLASDFVYFAAEDEDDNVWIGTEKGINRVKLNLTFDVVENLYFGYENGLTGVETNSNAFYLSDKHKYFGLIDGLYEFNELSKESHESFDLHLTDVEIFYGEYSPRDYADSVSGFFKIPYRPQLPPDKNHITFYFNRVDKRYPASVKFKYFLDGFDKKWSQPSSMRMATYSNLPPGDYVFRVMSTDGRGSWDDTKIAYAFTVKTPFYKTASFITGVFILVAGIITFILYMRVKQRVNKMIMLERIRIREQETLRKEIARDFHDEMGNQLTRIINYVSLLKLNGSSNGSHDLYTKVENSAKYLYTGTRDFIWSIDPVNDELSKLFIHIRDFGETLFEEKNIQFRAFNEVKEKVKLPYGFSREANLIFKEAMTNSFKYSEAKNVSLQLKRTDDDGFEMSFEDDGIGFYTDAIEKSNGLKNIRERADRIHAILRITSVKNSGTNVVLNFKLTKTPKYGIAL